MHGHACRVLGLSSGLCRSGKRSPLHVRLSSMTWTRTCGVYSRARSPPTLTRDHLYVYADTGRPPRNISCSARSSPARTPALTLLGSSSELFPGSPVTHRPPHGCLRTPRPPCPGPIGGSMNLVGRRVWAWVAAVPWGGGRGAGGNGRAPGRPGGSPGAVAGWLLMDGGSGVVYYVFCENFRDFVRALRLDRLYRVRRDVLRRANGLRVRLDSRRRLPLHADYKRSQGLEEVPRRPGGHDRLYVNLSQQQMAVSLYHQDNAQQGGCPRVRDKLWPQPEACP